MCTWSGNCEGSNEIAVWVRAGEIDRGIMIGMTSIILWLKIFHLVKPTIRLDLPMLHDAEYIVLYCITPLVTRHMSA